MWNQEDVHSCKLVKGNLSESTLKQLWVAMVWNLVPKRHDCTSKVPPIDDGEELWLCVRAVTETGRKHPLKCVTPEAVRVDFTLTTTGDERACLQCDVNSFDPATECVFLEVTPNERRKRWKMWVDPWVAVHCSYLTLFADRSSIRVRLFNWKKFGPSNRDGTEREDLRLCKLELVFCVRLSGQYHPVSPLSYTTLIEDGKANLIYRSVHIVIAFQ